MIWMNKRINPRGRLLPAAGLVLVTGGLLVSCTSSPPSSGVAGNAASPASSATATAAAPPARICGNKAILDGGPTTPPKGAVVIPAGDDSGTVLGLSWTMKPNTTYWFAPGKHILGTGQFAQIITAEGDTFIGAPGAILDGQ